MMSKTFLQNVLNCLKYHVIDNKHYLKKTYFLFDCKSTTEDIKIHLLHFLFYINIYIDG